MNSLPRIVIYFIFFLYAGFFANLALASDFSYSVTETFTKRNAIDLFEINRDFENQGFQSLDPVRNGSLRIFTADQAWISNDQKDSLVIYKQGLKSSDERHLGKLIKLADQFLYHGISLSGEPFALAFVNMSEDRINSVLQKMNLLNSRTAHLWLPKVYAADRFQANCNEQNQNSQLLKNITQNVEVQGGESQISSCFFTALKSAKERVQGTAEAVTTLITDPKAFWEQTREKIIALKTFLGHIKNEMKDIYDNLSGLDSQAKMQLTCTIAGAVAPGAAVSFLTGGGPLGLARYGTEVIAKLKNMTGVLKNMNKFKIKGTEEALACAIR